MKKQLLIFLFLTIITATGKPQGFKKHSWHSFDGKLGAADIHLSVYFAGGEQLKGSYCNRKNEAIIQLEGKIAGSNIYLTEAADGKVTGYFTGKMNGMDSVAGTWTNSAKTKVIPFELHSAFAPYPPSFSLRNEYWGEVNGQVEGFMKRVKGAILKGDRQWPAGNIHYPIMARVGNRMVTLKGKAQFLTHFDSIFTSAYKAKVGAACICDLFSNWQGVMLGNGEVWIDVFVPAGSKTQKLSIKAINN